MSDRRFGAYFGEEDENIKMRNISSSDFDLISSEDIYDYAYRTAPQQTSSQRTAQKTPPNRKQSSSQVSSQKAAKRQNNKNATKKQTNKQSNPKKKPAPSSKSRPASKAAAQGGERAKTNTKQKSASQRTQKSSPPKNERPISEGRAPSSQPKKNAPQRKKYILTKKEAKRLYKNKRTYKRLINSGKSLDEARYIIAKRKRMRRKAQNILSALLLFVFAFTLSFTYCCYEGAPIKNIEIEGESEYSNKKILNTAEISIGQNMLTVREKEVNEKVTSQLPLISKVDVNYLFPDTLKLNIISTKAEILIKNGSSYTCIDQTGKIVSLKKQKQQKDQFLVTGISHDKLAVGDVFDIEVPKEIEGESEEETLYRLSKQTEKQKYETVKTIVAYLKQYKLYPCKIDISDPQDIQIIYNSKIKIYFGDSSRIQNKIDAAYKLYQKNKNDYEIAYIDVCDSAYNIYKGGIMDK